MKTPIHDFLERYADSGTVRLHMPGGKGIAYPFDITEISGADELYDCSGIIRESERNAAELFGAADTCYSCGGSTLAVQAMFYAAVKLTGKHKIAAGRYSHKSLAGAAALLGIDVTWIYPDSFLGCGLEPSAVEAALDADTAAVFVTSVDYLGGEADIPAISEVCKRHGVMLLADNAHGAYKVFTGGHPITLGADMTADSAHKTLPALTGAAYLHVADASYYAAAKEGTALFGSSSPSYLMLDSLDLCNRFIADSREDALEAVKRVAELKKMLSAQGITLRKSDAMRVTVDANAMGYTGYELAEKIRQNGAECEMSGDRYVVLLFSTVQPEHDLERTVEVFSSVPVMTAIPPREIPVMAPEKRLTIREAMFTASEVLPTRNAAGRICAGIYSPCPPCVPLVMPGEIITGKAAELLCCWGIDRINVIKE